MVKKYEAALPKAKLRELAGSLGVTRKSLKRLHVGWLMQHDGPRVHVSRVQRDWRNHWHQHPARQRREEEGCPRE